MEVADVKAKVRGAIQLAERFEVKTEDDIEKAAVHLKRFGDARRASEAVRIFFVKPLKDHVKRIDVFFRVMMTPATAAESMLKEKIRKARAVISERLRVQNEKRERLAREKFEAEQKLAKKQKQEAPKYVPPIQKELKKTIGGATATKRWTFDVVEERKVSRDFLMIDQVAVNQAIRDGKREITGLRIYQKESIGT